MPCKPPRWHLRKWREVPESRRQAACLEIASKIEENSEELARILTAEQGKPLNGLGSRWEIGGAVAWTRYTASLSLPVKVLQDNDEGRVELHRKPIGVVGSITPWNFPVIIAIWHIVPAVLSGNTVVCKPSPYTPLSTLRLVELMNEVLPEGRGQLHRRQGQAWRRNDGARGDRQDRFHRLLRDRPEDHGELGGNHEAADP